MVFVAMFIAIILYFSFVFAIAVSNKYPTTEYQQTYNEKLIKK